MSHFTIKLLDNTGRFNCAGATSSCIQDAFRINMSGLGFARGSFPAMDVCENMEFLFVAADMSGVDIESLELYLADQILTLKGRRMCPWQDDRFSFHRMEISYGSFERILRLPAAVDAESADVSYQNGMLLIKLIRLKACKIVVKS